MCPPEYEPTRKYPPDDLDPRIPRVIRLSEIEYKPIYLYLAVQLLKNNNMSRYKAPYLRG